MNTAGCGVILEQPLVTWGSLHNENLSIGPNYKYIHAGIQVMDLLRLETNTWDYFSEANINDPENLFLSQLSF